MAANKYDEYVIRDCFRTREGRESISVRGDRLGMDLIVGYHVVKQPFELHNPPHDHDFNQLLCFFGTNTDDQHDFGGVVELCLGDEAEKQIIDTPAVVKIPAGLKHCPMAFTKVDKPFIFLEIMLVGEYTRKEYKE